LNPDEAVAIGAAIQGSILAPYQKDRILDDDIIRNGPYSLTKSIISKEEQPELKELQKTQSFAPGTKSEIIKEDEKSTNLLLSKEEEKEEVVYKNSNQEMLKNITLIDVTPLSLGIAVGKEDKMSVIIEKNSAIPIKKKKVYTTLYDNQKEVTIPVYQGENQFVKDNHFLGQFQLKNIPSANAGVPRFDTIF